jgi:Transposase domain (DUF772)
VGSDLRIHLIALAVAVRDRSQPGLCRRNVELMWLLGRFYPDHKSISEFRRMLIQAITAEGKLRNISVSNTADAVVLTITDHLANVGVPNDLVVG